MVLVYSDDQQLMNEMLGKATEIVTKNKGTVSAVHIGKKDDQYTKSLIAYGADKVIHIENNLETFQHNLHRHYLEKIHNYTRLTELLSHQKKKLITQLSIEW